MISRSSPETYVLQLKRLNTGICCMHTINTYNGIKIKHFAVITPVNVVNSHKNSENGFEFDVEFPRERSDRFYEFQCLVF